MKKYIKNLISKTANFLNTLRGTVKEFRLQHIAYNRELGLPRWILSGKVSRIHEQEARERYWILRRELESNIDNYAGRIGIDNWQYANDSITIDKHIRNLEESLEKKVKNESKRRRNNKEKNELEANKNTLKRFLNYYKILLKDYKIISRKHYYLNMLWRDMNFVRTRLIREDFAQNERIPYHLDFCRAEAANLAVSDLPEIKSLMNQAAEEINPTKSSTPDSNEKAARSIISLMIRLNDLRIKRLSEQLYKKKLYMLLLTILLVLSLIIWNLDSHLVPDTNNKSNRQVTATEKDSTAFKTSGSNNEQRDGTIVSILIGLYNKVGLPTKNLFIKFINWIVGNPLVFVYMAGLTGGFFSAMMRFQPLQNVPGDELYIRWYRITKPFIGAFGAMVLYIFVHANFFEAQIVGDEIKTSLLNDPFNATGFTFGFITGFSERFILPTIK